MIHDYGKVFNTGTRFACNILNGEIVVQEKIDGSQISFAIIDGELCFRSHKRQLVTDAPESLFEKAVTSISIIKDLLNPEFIYRGEFLAKPKHNTLVYKRVPVNHIILFDIEYNGDYLSPEEVRKEAERLGMEAVPTYFIGEVQSIEELLVYLKNSSILGGEAIEGVVIKNYNVPDSLGKFSKVKLVNSDFREKHSSEWKKSNPTGRDITQQLIDSLRTEARWNKAVQHLRENGELKDEPSDIGNLMKEVNRDILEEEIEEIKDFLFKNAWKNISRGVTNGLPEWYKRKLSGIDIGIDMESE